MKGFVIVLLAAFLVHGNALPRLHNKFRDASHTLIVGGRPAEQGEVPYQLQIQYYGAHHCGASLIEVQGVQVALTAAHCTPRGVPEESLTVIAGELNLSDNSGIEQIRQVTKIVSHAGFDYFTFANDISLLILDRPFELNENVQTIDLPAPGASTTGNLFVSGWGKLSYQGSDPDRLQTVEVPVIDDQTCQLAYDELGDTIYEHNICAGYLGQGGKDACQGDSGGPAKSLEGNYLAGVVSWGEECANPLYPGVYTEVSHFLDWINDNVAANSAALNKTE